ncbi:MAG: ankyrin repeat domain-containing protein [Armatimonadetes bacterium]|nr:ankyrin repeat domain-containing protein [Armatimonadota bacterium]
MPTTLTLAHRGGLSRADSDGGPPLYEAIGGAPAVARLIDGLYDRIQADRGLRPMFGGKAGIANERGQLKAFFGEWLGGPERYRAEALVGAGLRQQHSHLHLSAGMARRWLSHFAASAARAVPNPAAREELLERTERLAMGLVNQAAEPAPNQRLRCCHTLGTAELTALLKRDEPAGSDALASYATWSEHERDGLLHDAVAAGKGGLAAWLLEHSADPNRAVCVRWTLHLTPLCTARWKKRAAIAELLRSHGALDDVFTAAFLGDLEAVRHMLAAEPALLEAEDPASDVQRHTPLDHAVYNGQAEVARELLQRGARPCEFSSRQVAWAADAGQVELTRMLLDHGARADGVGAGRWVLHPALARLLRQAGATANRPAGQWIWVSCCGNNSQRDDPAYVAALLDCGADLQARLHGATALHFAAKAGFLGALRVLLERGADVAAVDNEGRTAMDWVGRSGARADREAVRRMLAEAGAGR